MNLNRLRGRNQKGVFLISAYLVFSVIGTFSLALFLKSVANYHAIQRVQNRITAFHLAEAAVDEALVQLKTNPAYTGTGSGCVSLGNGCYQSVVAPSTDPSILIITATGHTPNSLPSSYAYENRQIVTHLSLAGASPFDHALFSFSTLTGVEISHTFVDSYNSAKGPYNPATASSGGHVGTNYSGWPGITDPQCVFLSNSQIKGNVIAGPGTNLEMAIKITDSALYSKSTITGTISAASQLQSLPTISIPAEFETPPDFVVERGTSATLAGGTYYFNNFSIEKRGKLTFTGPAVIYTKGQILLPEKAEITTYQNRPPNLLIFNDAPTWHEIGVKRFYGAIYAPKSRVILIPRQSVLPREFYGSVVSDDLWTDFVNFHYDEDLKTLALGIKGGGEGDVVAWQEK